MLRVACRGWSFQAHRVLVLEEVMISVRMLLLGRSLSRLLAVALATLSFGVQADGGKLRVVTDNNYPPYVFPGPDGSPQGYVVDLWKLWEEKTGASVALQAMQWADAQRAILDGRADVIDMIFRTPVREQLYDFSQPYATLPVSIFVDPSINGIVDAGSMHASLWRCKGGMPASTG